MRTGNRNLMKQINASIILNLIRRRGSLSRTDVAKLSGLSPATVSGLTGEMMTAGLIQEAGSGAWKGGRTPILLQLNAPGRYVVGLKLNERSVVSVLADLEAKVCYRGGIANRDLRDPQIAIAAIIEAVESTLHESGIPRPAVVGIGLGLAGVIDSERGVCRYAPTPGWQGVQVALPLAEHFHLPICIENDVNTLTIAEQWFGLGRDVDNFLMVTIGKGIGAGVVVNGQLYQGAAGGAGELGHITIQGNDEICACGKRGCLETLAADAAVERMARAALAAGAPTLLAQAGGPDAPLSAAQVAAAAQQGDAVALDILTRAGQALGLGLSYLVNLFAPRLILLSGEGLRAGEALVGPARETMYHHILPPLGDGLSVVAEPLVDEAWARGAACVMLSEFFKHPLHQDDWARLPSRAA